MKTKLGVLPVQCKACGSTFDLWPDLLSVEGSEADLVLNGLGVREHFCWGCRQTIFGTNSGFEGDLSGLDVSGDNELELSWE